MRSDHPVPSAARSDPTSRHGALTRGTPGGPETGTPVVLSGVEHVFGRGENRVRALRGVDVSFAAGTWTAVMGPSGSGKSTLLHCAAGLLRPSVGSVLLTGVEVTSASARALTVLRRDRVGFVFQSFNLVPALTAAQNVELPLLLAGRRPDHGRTAAALARVGLADRAGHRPDQLSGGQQQRVAVARAFATAPRVIFADEPTGALDRAAGAAVLALFRQAVDDGATVVMVTHDPAVAARADRVLFLVDGAVTEEMSGTAEQVAARLAAVEDAAATTATAAGGAANHGWAR